MHSSIQPPLSHRVRLWSVLLGLLSIQDLGLTILALQGIPTAHEVNPLAALAFEHSVLAAVLLKLVGISAAICLAAILARRGHEARVHKTLVAWCAFYLVINGMSTIYLVGGI